jgi:decaprenylphospho-beta-D-ribofuranose 2-oxidase
VHGKNHHVDGSFSAHVQAITLLTADGRELQLTRQDHSRYFWATVGGMGLTGLILAVQLRLRRIPSAWYRVRYERAPDIDAAIARLAEEDNGHRYSVAWIDCLASGKSLGRSVLMLGNDAEPEELPTAWRRRPMAIPRKRRLLVPFDFPNGALTGLSVSAFNQVFYWKHAVGTHIVDYDSYFYPLDSVRHWNRIYGRRGFVQFQALFPEQTAAGGLRRVLEALSTARLASFLAVLKRSGAAGSGLLSYLFPGYTLALDIPNAGEDLRRLHDRLQRILLELGGRIYFAKDTLGTSEAIAAMYPRLEEFRAVQAELDPAGRIRSRLSSRLSLLKDR